LTDATAQSASADRRRALLLGALATLLYLATAPGVVNSDGLGYLKLLPHNFAAGHLLYMPLLRLATRLLGGDGLEAGRMCNALLGASGVVLFFGIVRRVTGDAGLLAADARFAATVAAAGLALSYGYWVQASDVEAYAAAMVALLTTVRFALAYQRRPSLPRAIFVGIALGVAVLFHLTHVCLSLFVVAALSRRRLHALTRRWACAATISTARSAGSPPRRTAFTRPAASIASRMRSTVCPRRSSGRPISTRRTRRS
jgi:hypothetical protein